jgi:hypothetical protein
MPEVPAILKTKLGEARVVPLRLPDGTREVWAHPVSPTGRPLTHDEASRPRAPAFRAAFLATAGAYPGRTPFRQMFGLVGGAGRIVLYDRFGLAARWEGGPKPLLRRQGIRFTAGLPELLAALEALPETLLAYPGAYPCPSCGVARVEPLPDSPYLRLPLCARCLAHVKKDKEWVGFWSCFRCGDRVKEDELACPWCARLVAEGSMPAP